MFKMNKYSFMFSSNIILHYDGDCLGIVSMNFTKKGNERNWIKWYYISVFIGLLTN